MNKMKWAGLALLVLSAPMWLSGYWCVVTGQGFLPEASDAVGFFRVVVGIYGPLLGVAFWTWG